ncbi:MAG: hypothetical protein HY315_00760 [Acidobacteria bacterium]|nr:hypothetical protein [Acidobacteriota bacterium]
MDLILHFESVVATAPRTLRLQPSGNDGAAIIYFAYRLQEVVLFSFDFREASVYVCNPLAGASLLTVASDFFHFQASNPHKCPIRESDVIHAA